MAQVAPEVKAAAIADLHGGEQPAVVAERYGVDRNTVKQWKLRHVTNAVPNVPDPVTDVPSVKAPIVKPVLERRNRLIGTIIFDLLAAKLEASEAIAKAASDPTWITRQSGSELAALGEWLDSTAFAIGDRLAQRANGNDESSGDATT